MAGDETRSSTRRMLTSVLSSRSALARTSTPMNRRGAGSPRSAPRLSRSARTWPGGTVMPASGVDEIRDGADVGGDDRQPGRHRLGVDVRDGPPPSVDRANTSAAACRSCSRRSPTDARCARGPAAAAPGRCASPRLALPAKHRLLERRQQLAPPLRSNSPEANGPVPMAQTLQRRAVPILRGEPVDQTQHLAGLVVRDKPAPSRPVVPRRPWSRGHRLQLTRVLGRMPLVSVGAGEQPGERLGGAIDVVVSLNAGAPRLSPPPSEIRIIGQPRQRARAADRSAPARRARRRRRPPPVRRRRRSEWRPPAGSATSPP